MTKNTEMIEINTKNPLIDYFTVHKDADEYQWFRREGNITSHME